MLNKYSNFASYLCEDGGRRNGLGPPIDDD